MTIGDIFESDCMTCGAPYSLYPRGPMDYSTCPACQWKHRRALSSDMVMKAGTEKTRWMATQRRRIARGLEQYGSVALV